MPHGVALLEAGELIALAVSGIALWLLLRAAGPLRLLDRPGGRKRHTGAIPMVGGLSIMAGLLASALWVDGLHLFERMLLGTAVALVLIGAVDDRENLGVRSRVLAQATLIILMMAVTGVHITQLGSLFGHEATLGWFGVPFTLIAMIGLLNAFNLADGIDGLASSLALVAIGAILVSMGNWSSASIGVVLALTAAAMVPQLAANLGLFGPRGKCFLGDAGSTLLGYLIGWSLIAYSQQPGARLSPVGTLWCVAIPVLDTLAVMVRRIRARQSPFKPGRQHLHYLLMDAGLGPRATLVTIVVAAVAIWGVGTLVRILQIGAGSNLIAFCVVLVAYTVATAKLASWVRVHGRRASAIIAPANLSPDADRGRGPDPT